MNKQKVKQPETIQEIIVEQLTITELEERILKLKKTGLSHDQIFLQISNGWQYGTLRLPQIKSLAHLRNIIQLCIPRQAVLA